MVMAKKTRGVGILQQAIRSTVESLEKRQMLSAGDLDPTWGVGGVVVQQPILSDFGQGTLWDTTAAPGGHFYNHQDRVTGSGFISNHDVIVDAGGKVVTVGGILGRHLSNDPPNKWVINNPAATGTETVELAEFFDSDFSLIRYDYTGNREYFLPAGNMLPNLAGDRDYQANVGAYPAAMPGNLFDDARALAVDSSGTPATNPNWGSVIVVGTNGYVVGSAGSRIVLARYVPKNGLVTELIEMTGGPEAPWAVNDMLVQPDGKIVIAGSMADGLTGMDFTLWRFNPDFTLDTSFGIGGVARFNFNSYSDDEAMAIALQPKMITNALGQLVPNPNADKIVAVGYSDDAPWLANGKSRMVAIAYNPNGTFDTTWGLNGILEIADLGGQDAVGTAITIQSDGKVLALGAYDSSPLVNIDPLFEFNWQDQYRKTATDPLLTADALDSTVLVRINGNGQIDQDTFGARGRINITGGDAWVGSSLAMESNGKIVIGGVTHDGVGSYAAVSRVTSDGFLDSTYGPGGLRTMTAMGNNVLADLYFHTSIAVQGDDKAIISANRKFVDLWTGGVFGGGFPAGTSEFVAEGVIGRVQADNKAPKADLLTNDITITDAGLDKFDFLVSYKDDIYVDLNSILAGTDITVTGPNGFTANAFFVSATGSGPSDGTNYSQFNVVYRIALSDPNWWIDGTNNGAYTITLREPSVADPDAGVKDTMGLYSLSRNLGQFVVDIRTPDITPPSATLVELPVDTDPNSDAGNIGVILGGRTSLDFIIEYSDISDVNRARLGDGDVLVTGPSNYSQIATFVSASSESNAPTIRVTYRIAAPGGLWEATDNGTYTIRIGANQISDNATVPNYIPQGPLVNFNVAIDPETDVRPIAFVSNSIGAPLNVQTFTDSGPYQEFFVHYTPSPDSTSGQIDASTIFENGGAIRVVSGLPPFDRFASYVSHQDDGAGGYIVTYHIAPSDAGRDWLGSDNGTYVIRIEGNAVGDMDSPSNFVPAGDLGTFTLLVADQSAPTVSLVPPTLVPVSGSTTYTVTVIYADDQAIDAATIDASDLSVLRTAGGTSISLSGLGVPVITPSGSGTPRTVTYTFQAPGGTWNYPDNGTYTISLKGNQVFDTAGNPVSSTDLALDTFLFQDLPPVASATFTPITAPGLQNLVVTVTYTDEVGVDWTSIDATDIVVSRFANGAPVDLQLVASTVGAPNPSVDVQSNGTPRIATYTFAPLGGYWESRDNGSYVIRLTDGAVSDIGGATTSAMDLAPFIITLPLDTEMPTAVTNAPNLVVQGAVNYSFLVTYSDNVAIDVATIDDFDIVVESPSGDLFNATLVPGSISSAVSAPTISAIYSFDRGGEFTSDDNGLWKIRMRTDGNFVTDVSGNAVAGPIGAFTVQVADLIGPTAELQPLVAPLPGAATYQVTILYSDANGIDLTTIDANDVVITSDHFVTLASAGAPVAVPVGPGEVRVTYSFTAPGGEWNYQDNDHYEVRLIDNQVRDTSGNPAPGVSGTFDFFDEMPWATVLSSTPVALGTGILQITVQYNDDALLDPATFSAGDILVSNGSIDLVATGTPTAVQIDAVGRVYNVTYSFLPPGGYWESSDNGTYTVTLLPNEVADDGGQFSTGGEIGSISIDFAVDGNAPTATLLNAPDLLSPVASYDFTVRYEDEVAVDYRTLGVGDIYVVGPDNTEYEVTVNSISSSNFSKIIDVSYRLTKPGGFNATDNGAFTVRVRGDQVADVSGNFITEGTIAGAFNVNAPVPAVTAQLASVAAIVQAAGNVTLQVTFSSTYPLDMSTLIGKNNVIRVTGPKGYDVLATYVSASSTSNGTSRTITYRINAPGGAWDFGDNGNYTVSTTAGNGVKNTAGGSLPSSTLGVFKCNLKASSLNGTQLAINGTDASDMIELLLLNGSDTNPNNDIIRVIVNNVAAEYDKTLVGSILIKSIAGNDTVKINSGVPAVKVLGGTGNDTVYGSDFNDSLFGEAGNDYIVGGFGADSIEGGDGDDRLSGTAGADTIRGGNGHDIIGGGNGRDQLFGDAGNDTITGGRGLDALFGGDGDDLFYSRDVQLDTLDGGAGIDRAQRDASDVLDIVVANTIEQFLA